MLQCYYKEISGRREISGQFEANVVFNVVIFYQYLQNITK